MRNGKNLMNKRYCKNCKQNIYHDKTVWDERERDIPTVIRGFLAIFTLGITEFCREPAWECQKCGKITDRK